YGCFFFFFLSSSRHFLLLHSFPTRRSSDLDSVGHLLANYIDLSIYTDSTNMEGSTYVVSNTVFWFAYSATWAMLHSVFAAKISRSEEHTSELQSRFDLVCRLLLEKNKKKN